MRHPSGSSVIVELERRRPEMIVELKTPARDWIRDVGAAFTRLGLDHGDATLVVHRVQRLTFEIDR